MFTLAEDDEARPGWRPNEPPKEAPGFTSKDGRVWLRGGWHALPFRQYARVKGPFLSADEAMDYIEHDAMEHANTAPPAAGA